jgi:4-hydroxy-3-polyprenylbenzoate decarboxylase
MKKKIAVAVTGASGSIYASVLFKKLVAVQEQLEEVSVVMSDNAKDVWRFELGHADFENYPFRFFHKNDFMSPIASGSAKYDALIVCPCSMGTLGRIAGGMSNDLITRAADVMLKERRKLLLVTRETPLNLIHLRNMTTVTEAGAIVVPASPSFYSRPENLEEMAGTVVDRVLDLVGVTHSTFRWGK